MTLIFGLDRYDKVMDAYLTGLEAAKAAGNDLSTIRSVASFFVSRVDTEIDKRLDKIGTREAAELRGKAGIANARLAYERYEKVFGSDRWKALEAEGAHPQRPLWASTGVKDPAYDDTMYVVELCAPNTVNTMPEATLDAVADHGVIKGDQVTGNYDDARQVIDALNELGVTYDDVIEVLEVEGVQKFEDSYAQLAESVKAQLEKSMTEQTETRRVGAGSGVAGAARDRAAHPAPGRRAVAAPRRQQPAARPARPAAAARAGAVRARRVRRDRRPGAQEAAARRSTTWPTAACCRPTSCCSVSPAATGATATSRSWPRRRRRSTRAPTGRTTSGRACRATSCSSPAPSTTTRPSTRCTTRSTTCASRTASRATPRSTCRSRRRCSRPCCSRWNAPGWPTTSAAGGWRRVVVEKPFGHDLPSALELNKLVDDVFTPQDVFRIDHYLGKETVQNILALRFANQLFEPVFNANFVDSVQITMAEDVGIAGRAAFYDATGAARDVLQNHLLQLLALVAMEEPVEFTAEAIQTEKLKVLRAITLPHDLEAYAVRGQYDQGWQAGERVARLHLRGRRPRGLDHRDLRRGAAGHRHPPLGGCAVLPAHRQAAAAPGHRDRGAVQEGAAPAVQPDRHRGTRAQPAGHPRAARRGRHAEVRFEGARLGDGGPRRVDGLPLRRGVHRVLARGLRAADPRRPARRLDAVPAQRRGRGVLAGDRPARGVLDRPIRRRSTAPANGARRRPTRCSRGTDGAGGDHDNPLGHDRHRGRQGARRRTAHRRRGDVGPGAHPRRRDGGEGRRRGRGGRVDRGVEAPDAGADGAAAQHRGAGPPVGRRGVDGRPVRARARPWSCGCTAGWRCTPSR